MENLVKVINRQKLTAKHTKSTFAKASVDKNTKCAKVKYINSKLCDLCLKS